VKGAEVKLGTTKGAEVKLGTTKIPAGVSLWLSVDIFKAVLERMEQNSVGAKRRRDATSPRPNHLVLVQSDELGGNELENEDY